MTCFLDFWHILTCELLKLSFHLSKIVTDFIALQLSLERKRKAFWCVFLREFTKCK